MTSLPSFDELPLLPGLDLRHAWDVFGPDDVLGSINLVTPARVARAATLVTTGRRVSLDLPLNLPDPPLFGREPFRHTIFPLSRNEMDDRLDNFHLQGSTQWDALGHVRCREHGYWGGRTEDPTDGSHPLGIDAWTEHGIAGRGVLIDVARWAAANGTAFDPLQPRSITVAELEATLESQGTALEPGDLLCIRTGWPAAYRGLDRPGRVGYAEEPTFAGLSAGEDMARFLWNAHPAAICCDNPAVEVVPGDPQVGSLHRRLLPTLGMALGEMFDFETLHQVAVEQDRSTFFFVAAPVRVPGAIGSPGNAVAIL